jgi:hypothetical protein
MSDKNKALGIAIGEFIAALLFDVLIFWVCWDVPKPYFGPTVLAMLLLNWAHNSLIRMGKALK